MDPAPLVVRLRDRRGHLPDALSALLRICLLVLVAAPPLYATAQPLPSEDLPAQVAPIDTIPGPSPVTIQPRVLAAYGALLTAAMLSILYLYRGRAFIVYWLGSWMLLAGALAIGSQAYGDIRLSRVLTGLALLCVTWSAGLTWLAAEAFPQTPLRWSTPIKIAAVTAVWFLAAPFVLTMDVVIGSGIVVGASLLGAAAVRYITLGRLRRHVGSFLIGGGLVTICVANLAGAAVTLQLLDTPAVFGRVAVINAVTSVFVALGMHLLVFEDMTDELRRANHDLAEANEEVKRLAITDPLTGCHNRRFFDEIERREMQRHRRYGAPLAVVFVDVNHFKQLNDTFGHDRGDDVLRAIGALLRRQVRESDYVIRWGGDEFLLLLTCGQPEAEAKAADLKLAFERERESARLPDGVGLSIGVAVVSPAATTLNDAIREADGRMYRDKLGDRAQT